MSEQTLTLPFLSARTTDPATSVEAAKQLSGKTDREVLAYLQQAGRALTADQIVAGLDGPRHPPTVVSAISRLRKAGLVVAVGARKSARGRPAITWKAST